MTAGQGYGYLQPNDTRGGYNPIAFILRQLLGRVSTFKIAEVIGVGAGTVDVRPLVSMVDSQGNATPHGIIYGIKYLQMQAGTAAIVATPIVGQIGLIGVCDRDSSAAISSLAPGPPPSGREFDLADAVYIMSVAGDEDPTTTITINETGITLADAAGNVIAMTAAGIALTPASGHPVVVNGDLHATGDIIGGFGGIDQVTVQLHEHSANNTPPTPGT